MAVVVILGGSRASEAAIKREKRMATEKVKVAIVLDFALSFDTFTFQIAKPNPRILK